MTIKAVAKFCSVAAIVLVVLAALGPANWAPRTELGWEMDHFLGWFAITSLVCFAWPRPFVVGGALMAFAALLEGLQAFTPNRSANLLAAVCGAGGALGRHCLLSSLSEPGGGVPARRKPRPYKILKTNLVLPTQLGARLAGIAQEDLSTSQNS